MPATSSSTRSRRYCDRVRRERCDGSANLRCFRTRFTARASSTTSRTGRSHESRAGGLIAAAARCASRARGRRSGARRTTGPSTPSSYLPIASSARRVSTWPGGAGTRRSRSCRSAARCRRPPSRPPLRHRRPRRAPPRPPSPAAGSGPCWSAPTLAPPFEATAATADRRPVLRAPVELHVGRAGPRRASAPGSRSAPPGPERRLEEAGEEVRCRDRALAAGPFATSSASRASSTVGRSEAGSP